MQDECLIDTIKTVFFCKISDISVYLIKKLWNLNRYSLHKAGVELNEASEMTTIKPEGTLKGITYCSHCNRISYV